MQKKACYKNKIKIKMETDHKQHAKVPQKSRNILEIQKDADSAFQTYLVQKEQPGLPEEHTEVEEITWQF
jgi:hypothetical protein